ncbi:YdcF family protein [Commensalibacter oyaizuii]|uniref:YdcF family protein n=1 Tax=Commensalibacter oyaizuii TaxID=3043873 RepID=A0ABT6Q0U0_9PROT|nr:YdcF family protein [Commensalibacter sp. TBRC 16381]MDI2090603.1 YdcF family protein [Commensalibacter sp. TBRC 16381]
MTKFYHRSKQSLFWGVLIVLGLWLGGFLLFIVDTLVYTPPIPTAEGIVVLTGGARRIDTAIKLLQSHHGKYLLISGVQKTTTLKDLEHILSYKIPASDQERITLGYSATSTMGNAIETAAWAHHYKINSLIIVTSSYHIRRALLEMQDLLYDVQLFPYVARSDNQDFFSHLHSFRLLFLEYNKLLAAYTGLIHTTKSKENLLQNTL